ncbi:hypothetical protein FRC12_020096 [Ceratobasidium sp. 428]|nr:hypothetical protein FRC12_020096 [Ceratobasidium sp. 428]
MHALNALAFGAASLFVLVDANHGHLLPRSRHHGIAKRGQSFSGQATYYEAGMGACGKSNTGSDKASSFSVLLI